MLSTVSEGKFEDVTAELGRRVTFSCYSVDAGVEWRCSSDKYKNSLIYSRGVILSYASEFSMEMAGGWYNLTMTVTSSNATRCDCFKAGGGKLIKQYRTTYITGSFAYMKCIYS